MHRRVPCAFLALVVTVTLGGCASPAPPSPQDASTATASPARPADGVSAPPAGAAFDYQLGGPYDPPAGATVIARDRKAPPAGKGYDICYVNGFQTQPDESAEFAREHADLLLHVDGSPMVDPGWPDEFIFDTSTAENRRQLATIVGDWITGCKAAGYEGVEIDNLDSSSRSNGAITADDNIALAAEYAAIAHRAGLAIAQKNTPDHSAELRAAGYDFAVTESCMRFSECAEYTDVYPAVLDIEYTDELGVDGFREACSTPGHPSAMILRDPKLVTPSDPAYHFETCPR